MHFTKTNRFQLSHNVANQTAQFALCDFYSLNSLSCLGLVCPDAQCSVWFTVTGRQTDWVVCFVLGFHSSSVVVASLYIHTGGIMHVGKPRTRPNVNLYFLNNEWKFVLCSCHTLKSLSHLKIVGSEGSVLCAFLWCQSAFSWSHFPVVSQWWHLQLRRLAQNAL